MADPSSTPRLRFRPRSRMRSKNDFSRLFATASRARGRDISIAVCPNGLGFSRLGLSVGKRCWRGAVGRNRVRRVFREAFRLSLPELAPGYDILMIAIRPRLVPELDSIQKDLVRLSGEAVAKGLAKANKNAERDR